MAFRRPIIRCLTRQISAMERQRTSSFFVSKRMIRSSHWLRPRSFSKTSGPCPWWRWSINVNDPIRYGRSALLTGGMAVALAFLGGCRQDMQDQPKMIPLRHSAFFDDGRSARPQVANTVARGQVNDGSYFYTGVVAAANGYKEELDVMPFPATMQVLQRGEERFNIYCNPCHSRVGNGAGMIVQRGYKAAGNFHDSVRRTQKLGHYFYVMTNGYGAMPDYSEQLTPEDRWAVAAYIRALQLSQDATEKDVPAGVQVESLESVTEKLG